MKGVLKVARIYTYDNTTLFFGKKIGNGGGGDSPSRSHWSELVTYCVYGREIDNEVNMMEILFPFQLTVKGFASSGIFP